MAIIEDTKRNRYYINYKYTLPDGTRKNINVRNKAWIIKGDRHVSKRYMQNIELDEIEKDKAKRNLKNNKSTTITLNEATEDFYLFQKSQGIDNDTIINYRSSLNTSLFKTLNKDLLVTKAITVDNIEKVRIDITSSNNQDATKNAKLMVIKGLINYIKRKKYINVEIADDCIDLLENIRVIDRNVSKKNFFIHGEEDLQAFKDTFKDKDQNYLMPALTIFYGALRIGEALAITRDNLDFEKSTILINKQICRENHVKNYTKNRVDKIVRIPRPFMEELKQYVEDRQIGFNEYVFLNSRNHHLGKSEVEKVLKKHFKEIGLDEMTVHGLRHSFATRMFDKGYDVREVQQQLGHKSMNTTMKFYIHYTQNNKDKSLDDLL